MRKLLLFLVFALGFSISSIGQTAVNPDGSIKFRGNVAVFANGEMFDFSTSPRADVSTMRAASKDLANAMRTLAIAKFGDIAFGIVNRDDEAAKQVQSVIEENKLEDYLNGYSVQAKNQGADWLFIINMAIVTYPDNKSQILLDSRLVNVENNKGYHHHYASRMTNPDKTLAEAPVLVREFINDLNSFLYSLFPEQYFIAEAKGKNLILGPYQTNGRILPTDTFYGYKYEKHSVTLPEVGQYDFQVVEPIGTASEPKVEDGKLTVKVDKKLNADPQIIFIRNLPEVTIWQPSFNVTYFGLDYDNKSLEGLARQRVNNAMLSALTQNPFVQLIEQEAIQELHNERELQKSEDFLNGHTVEQMKSIGADYIIKIDNYKTDGKNASFTLNIIDVAANKIIRQMEIESSTDDLELAIRKNLYDRFNSYSLVDAADKNSITIYTPSSIPTGSTIEFYGVTQQINPSNNEPSYQNSLLASGEVIQSNGQKSIIKPLNKTDVIKNYNDLVSFSQVNNCKVKLDGSKIKVNINNKDYKPQKSKRSFLDKLNDAAEKVNNFNKELSNSGITIESSAVKDAKKRSNELMNKIFNK